MLHTPVKPLLWRTRDAAEVNAVLNHESVLPTLGLGFSQLDAAAILANPRNIAFMGEYGGAIFMFSAPGVYEAHDYFLPEGRGAWAKEASKSMLSIMFDAFGAEMIWAQTPVENRACALFNRILGFRSSGREEVILFAGAEPREVEIFTMRKGDVCL